MEIKDLIIFLKKFEIKEEKIKSFIGEKLIIEKNSHFFLTNQKDKIIKTDLLLFINLKFLLPSKFLLNFIFKNSENIVEVKSEKQAMNFTYGKDLSIDSIIKVQGKHFKVGIYYLLIYKNLILGYFEYLGNNQKNKKHPLFNLMNIGRYLKE